MMSELIEFRRCSATYRTGLKKVYVFNQSDPVYAENKSFITAAHIVSAIPDEDPFLGPVILLKLTEKGMNLINEVACDNALPMLILFINGASFDVFHKVHKLDDSEARLAVRDMDFANMIQVLIDKAVREH